MGTMTLGIEATAAYRLTDEQELLRQTVRQLADERIAPRAAEIDTSEEFPWDVKELLAGHEILALPFPPVYGGGGGGGGSGEPLPLCLPIEEIARVCVPSSLILAVQALGSRPILIAGTDEQKRRWIPDLAAGKRLPRPPAPAGRARAGPPHPPQDSRAFAPRHRRAGGRHRAGRHGRGRRLRPHPRAVRPADRGIP